MPAILNHDGSIFELYSYQKEEEFEPASPAVKRKKLDPKARAMRQQRRARADTVIVPAREDGFKEVFLDQDQWYAIRIGAAMRDKLKYIAAYQVSPVSAITHIAEIDEIKPYKDTGNFLITFINPAKKLRKKIGLKNKNNSPQGPIYVSYDVLKKANYVADALISN